MNQFIRILHLEDDAADAELARITIESSGLSCQLVRVQERCEFSDAILQLNFDLIIADFQLPSFDGMSALKMVREQKIDVPFIFLSGTMGEDAAIEALTEGATDYVLKQKMARLAPALRRALRDAENHRELRRTQAALEESEAKYRTIFENSGTAMILIDDDMTIVMSNKEFEKLSGYPREWIDGKRSWAEFVAKPADLAQMTEYHRARRTDPHSAPQAYVFQLIDRHGQRREISSTVVMMPGTLQSVAALTDITERIRAGDALKASELRFRKLIEDAPVAIFIHRDDKIDYANPRSVAIFGADSPDDLRGHTLSTHFGFSWQGPDAGDGCARSESEFESIAIRQDGSEFPVLIANTQVQLADGEVTMTYVSDITARKQAEELLKHSHEQLRQLAAHIESTREAERQWVGREVHDEIGQYLTALKIDLVWVRKHLHDDQKPLCDKTTEMTDMVNSAMESVKSISARLRPISLDDLGTEAALDWLIDEFEKHTEIACDKYFCFPTEHLDSDRSTALFRILQESLGNVARHSEATAVKLALMEVDGNAVLSVEDNGKGIDPACVDNTRSFGLIGMRERARYFGGDVQIQPGINGGTLVKATIPLGGK